MAAMPCFLFFSFLASFSHLVYVLAQTQSGFISVDCGLAGNSSYSEPLTGLTYVGDSSYIDTGETATVSDYYRTTTLLRQLATARTFPHGTRNCYKVNVNVGTRYLIRASFLYANFDGKNTTPESFDLHFGPNYWSTVSLQKLAAPVHEEIIHISTSSYVQVCLVKTGSATPFISALEFRPIPNITYSAITQTLHMFLRPDLGSYSSTPYRFPYDVYDRIWYPITVFSDWTPINTTSTVSVNDPDSYNPPSVVIERKKAKN